MNYISDFLEKPFVFNPLNTKLNPICHLLALLGAHHILHVSRIRVKVTLLHKIYFFLCRNSSTWA